MYKRQESECNNAIDRYSPVDIQEPAGNRIDKIAAKGGAPDKEITDGQRKHLNNLLNKYESNFNTQHLSLIHI